VMIDCVHIGMNHSTMSVTTTNVSSHRL